MKNGVSALTQPPNIMRDQRNCYARCDKGGVTQYRRYMPPPAVHAVHPVLQRMQQQYIRLYGQMRGTEACAGGVQLKPPAALQPSPTQPFFPPVSVPFNHSASTPHISSTTETSVYPRQLFNLQCCNASARGFNRREVQDTGMMSIISFG